MKRSDMVVLFLYALLTLIITWPLPSVMGTALAGQDVDVYINPWADWWTGEALHKGLSLYYTDYIFYPHGVSLVFHSFSHVNTVISLLLTPLIGRIAAYNVTILLAYVLSGFSMYLLVNHLTACRPAAFVAGLVFAFNPYHVFESIHPVLVTTEWMPLFMLALIRMLNDTGGKYIKQLCLATLWFLLTALSSWHLAMMLAGLAALYSLYHLLFKRTYRLTKALRRLALLVVAIGLAVAPFLWPIIGELVAGNAAYMAADDHRGLANDVASFFIPNRQHPLLGGLFSALHQQIGFTSNRSAYLGYVALALAVVGVVAARRRTRFWLLVGLLVLALSLGSRIELSGEPLHAFDLPWAVPIISLMRHPFRISVLLFFSLSILAGFGGRWLYRRVSLQGKGLACLLIVLLTGLLLFEYWVSPFPTTRLSYSPFLDQLAREEGDFAVVALPLGRQHAKRYLFFQTIHGKKLVNGCVSRTPDDAYEFIATHPLLGALRAGMAPDPGLDVKEQFASLASQDIRYIIVHKSLLGPREMEIWQQWQPYFPFPFYLDDRVIVYRTAPASPTGEVGGENTQQLDVQLGDHIRLQGYRWRVGQVMAEDMLRLEVTLWWRSDGLVSENYHVFVHLLGPEHALVAQHDGPPALGMRPTGSWQDAEIIQDEHVVFVETGQPAGPYTLCIGMYEYPSGIRLPAFGPTGERLPNDCVAIEGVRLGLP